MTAVELSIPRINNLTLLLEKLLQINNTPENVIPNLLTENEVEMIVDISVDFLSKRNMSALIEVDPPITLCGDTHGQFNDVIRLVSNEASCNHECNLFFSKILPDHKCGVQLENNGWPPQTRYLFLGDYVDRGPQSVETICLMLLFHVRYPNDFHILRGNHETPSISRIYGFYEECKVRYTVRLWRKFQTLFSYLPLCALVASRIFCMHGGLSPSFLSFDQFRTLQLPFDVPEYSTLTTDTLWSDPDPVVRGFHVSRRGISYIFGPDVVLAFCQKFKIDMIVRAHQVVSEGFEFFANRKLLTIFSAPNYCGQFQNSAASLFIDRTLSCHLQNDLK